MENGKGKSSLGWLMRAWLALTGRKVRLLEAGEATAQGPVVFAVSHPPGLREALVLAMAFDRPVRFLLPESVVRGPLSRFVARRLGAILQEADKPVNEAALRIAIDALAAGDALVIFADPNAAAQNPAAGLASTAAALVWRAESQHVGRRVAVHPVHFFLPEAGSPAREILIYVDSPMERSPAGPASTLLESDKLALAAGLASRLRENAFQLRPADIDYFLADLEETLRAELQEDWSSLPDWKQDAEGFVLSRQVADWVRQSNYLDPSLLVTLRNSLEGYRSLQRKCALRQQELEQADRGLRSLWVRAMLWTETFLGLPIALFGLVNHLGIGFVLFLAGSFRKESIRPRRTEWIIRGGVALVFYAIQIFLVAHGWGRAAAGYYAPALPISGAYLWRYARLVRPQGHLLLISATLPSMKGKIKEQRRELREELDRLLASYEEKASLAR